MIGFLAHFDQTLFAFFNQTLSWAPLDAAFAVITNKSFYVGVTAIVTLYSPIKYRRPGLYAVICALLALALADAVAARFIKPWVGRPRPLYELAGVRAVVEQGDTLGFPSNHAANTFALAVVVLCYYRRLGVALLVLAALVSYSRVYVGVHYPGDVLAGAALGSLFGVLVVSGRFYADSLVNRWRYVRALKRGKPPPGPFVNPG